MRRCFFFQAEDGIRDDLVTGVQTCALPILPANAIHLACESPRACGRGSPRRPSRPKRSEERRVGKECRSGGSRHQYKTKKRKIRVSEEKTFIRSVRREFVHLYVMCRGLWFV